MTVQELLEALLAMPRRSEVILCEAGPGRTAAPIWTVTSLDGLVCLVPQKQWVKKVREGSADE